MNTDEVTVEIRYVEEITLRRTVTLPRSEATALAQLMLSETDTVTMERTVCRRYLEHPETQINSNSLGIEVEGPDDWTWWRVTLWYRWVVDKQHPEGHWDFNHLDNNFDPTATHPRSKLPIHDSVWKGGRWKAVSAFLDDCNVVIK